MSRDQLILSAVHPDEPYGPSGDFCPREWQNSFVQEHQRSERRLRESAPGMRHDFCLYAGTGSGKTKAAAMVAARLLNAKTVEKVVFVCPNNSICRKTQKDFMKFFKIDLVRFRSKSHADGVPSMKQGYVLTYSHLFQNPELHGRICAKIPTLVIFDEIHHLGDRNSWGDAGRTAFDRAVSVLTMTGTPYRSDNTLIPFVAYEPVGDTNIRRFRPDYSYNLGRAVSDGVCRKPVFHFSADGVVNIRFGAEEAYQAVGMLDDVPDEIARARLRGAVKYSSTTRLTLLREALAECFAENRKVIIFLGGDTMGDQTPTEDAMSHLPTELQTLGLTEDDYEVVVGDDKESLGKIERFGASGKRVLVSINMVSEGTDIPQISAAIFLTSISAKQTTIQRIGRALRLMGPDDPMQSASIYMLNDPNLREIADEIEKEIAAEARIKSRRDAAGAAARKVDENPLRAEAIGVSGGHVTSVVCNGEEYPIEVVREARKWCIENGLPDTEATYHSFIKIKAAIDGERRVS